jgi:hypothetical protein
MSTVSSTMKTLLSAGEVTFIWGAELARVNVVVPVTGGLIPSSTVKVSVKAPLSVQEKVVVVELESPNLQVVPAVTSTDGV